MTKKWFKKIKTTFQKSKWLKQYVFYVKSFIWLFFFSFVSQKYFLKYFFVSIYFVLILSKNKNRKMLFTSALHFSYFKCGNFSENYFDRWQLSIFVTSVSMATDMKSEKSLVVICIYNIIYIHIDCALPTRKKPYFNQPIQE